MYIAADDVTHNQIIAIADVDKGKAIGRMNHPKVNRILFLNSSLQYVTDKMLNDTQPSTSIINEFENDVYNSTDFLTEYMLINMVFTHPEKFHTDKWY